MPNSLLQSISNTEAPKIDIKIDWNVPERAAGSALTSLHSKIHSYNFLVCKVLILVIDLRPQ